MAAVCQADSNKNNLKRVFARLTLSLGLTVAVLAGCGDTNTAAETNPDLPGDRTTAPAGETQYSDSEVADKSDGVIAIRDKDINQGIAEVNFYGDSNERLRTMGTMEFSDLSDQEAKKYASNTLVNFAEGQAEILSNLDNIHATEDETGGKTFSSKNPEEIKGGEAFMQITSIPGVSGRSEAGSDIEMLPALKFSAQSGGEGFDMLLEHNSNKKIDSPEDVKDMLENAQENKVKFSSLEQSPGTDVYNDDEEGMYGFDAWGDKSKNPLVFRSGINSAYNTLSSVQEELANPEAPRRWENLNFEEKVNLAGTDTVLDALRKIDEGDYSFDEDETKDWPEGSPGANGFLVRGIAKEETHVSTDKTFKKKEIAIHQNLDLHEINVSAKITEGDVTYYEFSVSINYPEDSELAEVEKVEDSDKLISALEAEAYKPTPGLKVGMMNLDNIEGLATYGNYGEEPEFSNEGHSDPEATPQEQFLDDLFRIKAEYGLGGNEESHKQIS